MQPSERLNLRQILVLQAYWFGLSFMWNSLHVIILPAVLLHMVPVSQKNTYLGLLTFFGLIIALVVQPVSGSISDSWRSRWGRRRPLIVFGTLFDILFLAFLGWAGGIVWIAVGYMGLQLSSNIAHGPLQGLLPDTVPPEQLGLASGIKNLMDMAGLVAASLLVGRLLSPETRHPVGVTGLVAGVLAAGALVTILGTRERSSMGDTAGGGFSDSVQSDLSGLTNLPGRIVTQGRQFLSTAVMALRRHPAYAWLIASRFFYLFGVYGIQVFAQYYVRDVLAVENPVRVTGDLLAAITLALTLFTVLGGWLGDHIGYRRLQGISSAVGVIGCLLLLFARTPESLLLFGSILGAGTGLFLTGNWALANRLAPTAEAGLYLGLTNLATAGAGALGRLEGPLLDILNNARPGEWWGYLFLFSAGAVCILLSAALLRKVRPERQEAWLAQTDRQLSE